MPGTTLTNYLRPVDLPHVPCVLSLPSWGPPVSVLLYTDLFIKYGFINSIWFGLLHQQQRNPATRDPIFNTFHRSCSGNKALPWSLCRFWQCVQKLSTMASFSQNMATWGWLFPETPPIEMNEIQPPGSAIHNRPTSTILMFKIKALSFWFVLLRHSAHQIPAFLYVSVCVSVVSSFFCGPSQVKPHSCEGWGINPCVMPGSDSKSAPKWLQSQTSAMTDCEL